MDAVRCMVLAVAAGAAMAASREARGAPGDADLETRRIREVLQTAHRLSGMGKLGRFDRLRQWDFGNFEGKHIRRLFDARRRKAQVGSLTQYLDLVLGPTPAGRKELQAIAGFFSTDTVVAADVSWALNVHDAAYTPLHGLPSRAFEDGLRATTTHHLRALGLGVDVLELQSLIDMISLEALRRRSDPSTLVSAARLRFTLHDFDPSILRAAERLVAQKERDYPWLAGIVEVQFANLALEEHYCDMVSGSSLLVVCRNTFRQRIVDKGAAVLRQAARILSAHGLLATDGRAEEAMSQRRIPSLERVLSLTPSSYVPERHSAGELIDPALVLSVWRRRGGS